MSFYANGDLFAPLYKCLQGLLISPLVLNLRNFYNKGSKYCYYIDEVPGQLLDLIPDTEYIFNINTPGHPFYFFRKVPKTIIS